MKSIIAYFEKNMIKMGAILFYLKLLYMKNFEAIFLVCQISGQLQTTRIETRIVQSGQKSPLKAT